MNDETKAELMKRTREWLQSCVNAATRSGVPEEADLEAFILAHIDGEPARRAAAREEQREWCARHWEQTAASTDDLSIDDLIPPDVIRATPLDATPLADELRTLREENDRLRTWVSTVSEALGAIEPVSDCRVEMSAEASAKVAESLRAALERANEGVRYWTDLAQAEVRDAAALRARVAELEAQDEAQRASSQRHMNGRESYWLEQRAKWIAEHDRYAESCKWHADRAEKAEAQVAAARKLLRGHADCLCGNMEPHHILEAMDEAAK